MGCPTIVLLAVCFSIFIVTTTNGFQKDSLILINKNYESSKQENIASNRFLLRSSRQTNQRPNRRQTNNNNYDEFSGLDTNWNSNNNQFGQNQGSNNGQSFGNRPNNQWSNGGNNGQNLGNRPNNQWSNSGNNGQNLGNRPNNQWSNSGNNGEGFDNRPNNQWSNTGNNGQSFGNRPNNQWSNNGNQNQGTNENWNNPDNQFSGNQSQGETTTYSTNGQITTSPVNDSFRVSCATSCRTRVTYEYNPVCGSDNLVYQNARYLECMRDCGIPTQLIHAGTCTNRP